MQAQPLPQNNLNRARIVIGTPVIILAVGGILAFVEVQFGFSLIILFPVIMGAIAGVVAQGWRQQFNLSMIVTILIAIVVALLTYFVYRYAEYLLVIRELSGVNVPSFIEYTELRAALGVSLSRRGSTLDLAGQSAYLLWGVEILLMLATSIFAARRDFGARTNR